MNITCRKQLNGYQDEKGLTNCTYLHISKHNHLIKNQWYIPVYLPTVWSLSPIVKKSNSITMILK